MSVLICVVDTSYLVELGEVDGASHPEATKNVRRRFDAALDRGAHFFVPLPCIFELGNHIAGVKNTGRRLAAIRWLQTAVEQSLAQRKPWNITPTQTPDQVLPALLDRFLNSADAPKPMGMVDIFTLGEAQRLKAKFANLKSRVHIWTNDGALKSREPDKEADPYLWRSDGAAR